MTWRGELKATAERALLWSGLPALSRLIRRRRVLILAYHNVVAPGVAIGGDSSLHLSAANFAAQLDLLQATHDIVPLSAVLDGQLLRDDRPRAVITFDDAYRGAVTIGIRELVTRALPVTIFVAPAFVGGRFFWWDAMTPADTPGPTEAFRNRALEEYRGADDAVRRWAERSGHRTQTLPDAAACASADELRAASSQPGVAFGSHSWSHPNLARLTTAELREELTRPLAWLRERFERVVPVISYPYGLSSPAVESAAEAAGYRAGVLVSGGWMARRPRNPFALPRLSVPAAISQNGFRLQTAGLFAR